MRGYKHADEQTRAEMVRLYQSGRTLAQIARDYGRSNDVVRTALRLADVPHRTFNESCRIGMAHNKALTADQECEVVEAYIAGMSGPKIAKQVGCLARMVYATLARHNVGGRGTPGHRGTTKLNSFRKHDLDHQFFREIDTEEKAWLLGFISADGCVNDNDQRHNLAISLAKEDKEILIRIRSLLKATYPIYQSAGGVRKFPNAGQYDCQAKVTLVVSSKEIVADLRRHGIHPAKSWTVRPWQAPSEALQCAYWRGCLDGDGCVTIDNRGRPSVGLCGNEAMVFGFHEYVTNLVGTTATPRRHKAGSSLWYAMFSGRTGQQVARLLYEGSAIALQRKKDMADQINAIDYTGRAKSWKHITDEQILSAWRQAGRKADAARLLGMPLASFYTIVRYRGLE